MLKKDSNFARIFNPKKIKMKKLFAMLAVTAIMVSCNDVETKSAADLDSARAAATADSLAAINALADSTMKPMMDSTLPKMDSSMKAMDTMKMKK
ncbi:MAG: hypothetical protein H7Z13_04730 [Ferruginibacter sp.]|nr:hypothetical protein [Ferruginibacter sp.]